MKNAVVIAREHLKSGLVGVSRRCLTFVALVATGLDLFAAESAYDVLVVGGTERGVRTAVAEAKAGKRVYLVTSFPYLGEDRAGTLELGFGQTCPDDPLSARLWHEESGLAAFDYWPARPSDGIRCIYRNDWYNRLSESRRVMTPSDSVWYDDDISYRCVIRQPTEIARVEVLALDTKMVSDEGVSANFGSAKGNPAATGEAVLTPKDGPCAGQSFVLRRVGKAYDVCGDYYGGRAAAISFVADVHATFKEAELVVRRAPAANRQLVSRIYFHAADPKASATLPTPLKVKRIFDDELIRAGVGFMTASPVRRILRDGDGKIAGVEIANRSGRRELRAAKVVDATLYGALDGLDLGGTARFSRVVIARGQMPEIPGVRVEPLAGEFPLPHAKDPTPGRAWRLTFDLSMADGRYPSFAAAEWKARELTWVSGTMDDADWLTLRSPAQKAKRPVAADDLPSWGAFDVVVVGGGTAGCPAAIAAARAGAKVLLVEYLNVLGGTGTDGGITGYYDGNHCGFTEEFKAANKSVRGQFGAYFRSETWRRMCDAAGVKVWLGAMGIGVRKEGARVIGVEVGTALGSGWVRAKCVIDGTGNSDLAAMAGADTRFITADEFALQSAGQAPHRLGYGGINSDFGFVNDARAEDVWLFGIRARAGMPSAWDIAKMPDSRERRRVVADDMLSGEDVAAHRTFPDVVVQPQSRQDSHGYLTDEFRFVSETSEPVALVEKDGRKRYRFNANVPLRALLPRGLDGIAVVGLGAGVARDVVPIVRMQADLMNMGYGVGVAAALAAQKGGDYRAIDRDELRRRLVEKGILRPEALNWTSETDTGSDALLAACVKSMGVGYRGSHVVFRAENRARALPLLCAAYRTAMTDEARQIYAKTLGLLGDATGVETLLKVVRGEEKIVVSGESDGAFGGGNRSMDGFLVALGRTRDARALEPLLARLEKVTVDQPVMALRGPTLALEALASPRAAPALAKILKKDGFHGFAVSDFRSLPPLGGYGLSSETDNCIRELALARTLWACGDHEGLARRTLEAYANDPRGVLSAHAQAVLNRPAAVSPYAFDYGGEPVRGLADAPIVRTVRDDAERRQVVREWTSTDGRLVLRSTETEYRRFPVTEYVPELVCRSHEPTEIVENFRSLSLSRPSARTTLRALRGTVCTDRDFQVETPVLGTGPGATNAFQLVAREGRSSAQWMPWWGVDFAEGEGLEIGFGWTGAWRADFAADGTNVTMTAGLLKTHFRLLPGETLRQPSLLVFRRAKGVTPRMMQTVIHRFMVNVKSPRDRKGELIHGISALTAGGGNKTPAMMKKIIDWKVANGMPFDCFWVDAGWNGPAHMPDLISNCGNMWYLFTGDWRFNPTVHPDGDLGKVADAAHAAGMRMLLWMEPERCVSDPPPPVFREHRDWLLPKRDADIRNKRQLVLDFGNPAALAWITDVAAEHVRRCKLDVFRQDFNLNTLPIWQANDAPDRQGVTEIRHIMGLWKFWDTLRARFPHLVIENCASGGRRLDFEAVSRGHSYCRTDYAIFHRDPSQITDVQNVLLNTLAYLPFQGSESTPAAFFDDYGIFSSFASGNVFTPSDWNAGIVKNDFTAEQTAWLKEVFSTGRRLMPFYEGDYYPLTDNRETPKLDQAWLVRNTDETRWCAWQMHRADLNAGFAIFFRRLNTPDSVYKATLGGIDATADYEVETWHGPTERMKGRDLEKLIVTLRAPRSFRLVFYRKNKQ